MIKKADIILIVSLIIIGLGGWWWFLSSKEYGSTVKITVNGTLYHEYPLDQDNVITIKNGGETNTVTISAHTVRMTDANCPGKDCIAQGAISHTGESIICLPHRVVIEITGGASSYDAIVS